MNLSSPDISPGDPIAPRFACEGDDLSPRLDWSGVPDGARELALICEDPDAPDGTFIHWTVHGLDPAGGGLEQGRVPAEAREGENDFGRTGYNGPCPPRGHGVHRYYFILFALGSRIELPAGFSAAELRRAMQDHVLEETSLMGTYVRE